METIESNNKFVSDTSTGDNYGKGWNLIFTTFIELLVVTLVYAVIQMPTGGIQIKPDGFEWYMVPIVMLAIGYGIFISGLCNCRPVNPKNGCQFILRSGTCCFKSPMQKRIKQ